MSRACFALLVFTLAAAAATAALAPPGALLQRLGARVATLQDQLNVVIADETYRQEAQNHSQRVGRLIRAEILFMWVPEQRTWLTVRNIRDVNGRAIPDSANRIEAILAAPGTDLVARLVKLQREGARFDIGSFARTTSNPMLAVQYLAAGIQTHFNFDDRGTEKISGTAARRITFTERAPIGVMLVNEKPAAVSGEFDVLEDDDSVAVARSVLRVAAPGNAIISVDFERNAKIGAWVPVHMQERYRDNTVCYSDYSNFRRFETAGRLVP